MKTRLTDFWWFRVPPSVKSLWWGLTRVDLWIGIEECVWHGEPIVDSIVPMWTDEEANAWDEEGIAADTTAIHYHDKWSTFVGLRLTDIARAWLRGQWQAVREVVREMKS